MAPRVNVYSDLAGVIRHRSELSDITRLHRREAPKWCIWLQFAGLIVWLSRKKMHSPRVDMPI